MDGPVNTTNTGKSSGKDAKILADKVYEEMGNIFMLQEAGWWDQLLGLLDLNQTSVDNLVVGLLSMDTSEISLMADLSTAARYANLTTPKGHRTMLVEGEGLAQSLLYISDVVESCYPEVDAKKISNNLFPKGKPDLKELTNDDFRKPGEVMQNKYPIAAKIFVALSQKGGRIDVCRVTHYIFAAVVAKEQAEKSEKKEKESKDEKRKRKKTTDVPIVKMPLPKIRNTSYTVNIDKDGCTVVCTGRNAIETLTMKWKYTLHFSPKGVASTPLFECEEINLKPGVLGQDSERRLNKLFSPSQVKNPQGLRGLELPGRMDWCGLHGQLSVSFQGRCINFRVGDKGKSDSLASAMSAAFGVPRRGLWLKDAATGVIVPFPSACSGDILTLCTSHAA
mmetsp:Transcript_2350/g.5580  ORF Transcript_2350/g.5580 Transcript_2350/m.5580 type:complete len:393 (-) Transcript_2350:185-1363(-)|eukprot:CAMPEP_0177655516 /NCGR_PEP_ID=MMETSP0447-20121125/15017_1 /TAXON_ID=0 /ORGANISM="Stygamoeba regulata, Strain BSH-02190019" /LENGTH=392 /DNA_ID=CAMNT_0019159457 /DNA_START=68 /DNA_END=1246 /DNA_ORIENTATION=+